MTLYGEQQEEKYRAEWTRPEPRWVQNAALGTTSTSAAALSIILKNRHANQISVDTRLKLPSFCFLTPTTTTAFSINASDAKKTAHCRFSYNWDNMCSKSKKICQGYHTENYNSIPIPVHLIQHRNISIINHQKPLLGQHYRQ